MKIKENKKGWFIVSLVLTIGYIGLVIYQAFNTEFDFMNVVIITLLIESLASYVEKK